MNDCKRMKQEYIEPRMKKSVQDENKAKSKKQHVKVFLKRKMFSLEAILSAYTQRHPYTQAF